MRIVIWNYPFTVHLYYSENKSLFDNFILLITYTSIIMEIEILSQISAMTEQMVCSAETLLGFKF